MEFGGIAIYPECSRTDQFVLSVTAGQQTNAEHPGTPGGEQVPYCVANNITIGNWYPQRLLGGKEEVWFRFGPLDAPSLDNHSIGRQTECIKRNIDFWTSA